jgi:hypothetical protein
MSTHKLTTPCIWEETLDSWSHLRFLFRQPLRSPRSTSLPTDFPSMSLTLIHRLELKSVGLFKSPEQPVPLTNKFQPLCAHQVVGQIFIVTWAEVAHRPDPLTTMTGKIGLYCMCCRPSPLSRAVRHSQGRTPVSPPPLSSQKAARTTAPVVVVTPSARDAPTMNSIHNQSCLQSLGH